MNNEENQKSRKKAKKGIVFIFIILAFGLMLGFLNSLGLLTTTTIPENIKLIMNACDVTQDQANEINNVLDGCGIIAIEDITHDEILDDSYNKGDCGYRITCEDVNNIILYLDSNKSVYIVRYANIDMYSNSTYKTKLSDFFLTSQQEAALRTSSENYVKSILSSPNSANFPWFDWQFSKNALTQIATVYSYVDAKNTFGTEVRSYFSFMYQINGDTYSLLFFEFDNKVIVDNRQ